MRAVTERLDLMRPRKCIISNNYNRHKEWKVFRNFERLATVHWSQDPVLSEATELVVVIRL